jgi:hypothetical protein
MQRHRSTTSLFLALGALLFALTLTPFCFAQNPTPTPQVYQVTIVQVKPEMGREWQDYVKNDANPAVIKSGVKQRGVWTTASFGEGGEYVIVTPIENYAQFDNPTPIVKALGQEGATALGAKRNRLINGSHSFVLTARRDLGIAPKPDYQFKLAVSARSIVAQGHTADFEKNARELSAVIAKTNARGVLVSKVGLGGNPNEYITLVLFDSFAEIGKFPEAYAKAAAEAKLTPAPAGTVANSEWRVYRFVPELSIIPATQNAENK